MAPAVSTSVNNQAEDTVTVRSVETAIRRFLAGFHPEGRGGVRQLAAIQNLWREVNSLTMLQLVSFIENKFAIAVRPIDFAPQNFSSVAAIARFVVARRPAGDRSDARPDRRSGT